MQSVQFFVRLILQKGNKFISVVLLFGGLFSVTVYLHWLLLFTPYWTVIYGHKIPSPFSQWMTSCTKLTRIIEHICLIQRMQDSYDLSARCLAFIVVQLVEHWLGRLDRWTSIGSSPTESDIFPVSINLECTRDIVESNQNKKRLLVCRPFVITTRGQC